MHVFLNHLFCLGGFDSQQPYGSPRPVTSMALLFSKNALQKNWLFP
jgi:hypothetical protein